MTKPDRIPCVVPGCRRTAPKDKYPPRTIIICGKHWRNLNRAERAEWRLARKLNDAIHATITAREGRFTQEEIDRSMSYEETMDRLWNLAIERSLGI